MDRSLKGLMRINRGRFFNLPHINQPSNPDIPNNPTSSSYTLADFGENAINNHNPSDSSHSNKTQIIFNYVTKNFRDRCISYESYKTSPYNGFVNDELEACKFLKADIVYTPYVNAAKWTNTDNENFILTVGSHYDNDGQSDSQIGDDNNRHDITADANTFLSDSIAVSARRDTPELFKNSTSEGFGMEFFEDIEALDTDYPNKDLESAAAEVLVDSTGYIITSNVHLGFANYFSIGDEVILHYGSEYPTAHITEVIDGNNLRIDTQFPEITQTGVYLFARVTLAGFCAVQAQSWAVPIVAGKLKVIKMTTGADWDTVRAAARATAKRNILGIPELDNTNWDIYRGFGIIQVQAAIDYINNNT